MPCYALLKPIMFTYSLTDLYSLTGEVANFLSAAELRDSSRFLPHLTLCFLQDATFGQQLPPSSSVIM